MLQNINQWCTKSTEALVFWCRFRRRTKHKELLSHDTKRCQDFAVPVEGLHSLVCYHLSGCFPQKLQMAVWRSGNASVSVNKVNVRSAQLVLGWVTVSGFDFRRQHFISVCNQPPRSTQPSTLCETVNEYQSKGVMLCGWGVKAGMV